MSMRMSFHVGLQSHHRRHDRYCRFRLGFLTRGYACVSATACTEAGTDVAATTFHKGGDGGGGFGTITEVVDASRGDEEEEDSSYDDEEHEQRAVFRSIAEMRPKVVENATTAKG